MDTQQAMEYLKASHAETDSQPVETVTPEATPATGEQTEETKAPAPETEVVAEGETAKADVPETAVEKAPQQQKKPSKQEKINHAFSREKQRHKAEMAEKDKRIAELEEKIKKYSVLEQGDFDPADVKSYIDHKIALNNEQGELQRLKDERKQMADSQAQQEAADRHSAQVEECFADDESREHYWALLRNGGQKFREFLNDYDPDGTIDAFVGDSDIAPLMISTLMRNPNVLKGIVEKRNPMRKMIALQQLENRLALSKKVGSMHKDQQGAQQTQPKKAPLPIIGSQVQTPGNAAESDKRDWNRYLAEHPRSGY